VLVENDQSLDEAEDLIRRALVVRPDAGYVLDSLGWLFYKRGDYGAALQWLKRALENETNDPVIYEHLGDTYTKLNQFSEAVRYYQMALDHKHEKNHEIKVKLEQARKRLAE
jgi:Tfp pilus assembly protein PilF